MKNVIWIFFAVFVTTVSCKKDVSDPDSLEGVWEMRQMTGAQIPMSPADTQAGNGTTIRFYGQNFEMRAAGKVVLDGSYVILKASAEIDGISYSQRIVFNDIDQKIYLRLKGTELKLCYGTIAADGATVTYKKLKD